MKIRGGVVRIGLWVLVGIEALAIVAAGSTKFTHWVQWSGWFEGWGYGAWFAALIGVVEVVGGLSLVVPRLTAWGGATLMAVMLGALYTTLTRPNELGSTGALIHLVVLAVIVAGRWKERFRVSRREAR